MQRTRKPWFWKLATGVVCLAAVLAALAYVAQVSGVRQQWQAHTVGQLVRYTKRRLEGHTKLEWLAMQPLGYLVEHIERPVPIGPLPTLGKGFQSHSLARQRYTPDGQPLQADPSAAPTASSAKVWVASADQLVQAIRTAKAGQTIEIEPGSYTVGERIDTGAAGSKDQPITVRASQPGQVTLEFTMLEGFIVAHPFWVFENLHIRGICKNHGDCEHAFHIVGGARSTVVRNNLIEDFNAHIKVNGQDGVWPDAGLLQFNTITNTRVRDTDAPVSLVDIVGANQWRVVDNIISNFVKGEGNQISYGAFMKGAGRGGRIERNLVVCTTQNISQPGERVGISFGGGATGAGYCRDQRCESEHTAGIVANNIVVHCNDLGIDTNHAVDIWITHNTLVNTSGIGMRGASEGIRVYGNILDGGILQRDGSTGQHDMNEEGLLTRWMVQPDALQLGWRRSPDNIPSLRQVPTDFCGQKRLDGTPPGALVNASACAP